jgi:hypothetical protein
MQQIGLFVSIQQLKFKVAKITQEKVIPFTHGVPKQS